MTQNYYDRINEHDDLTGGIASYNEVHKKGLWHRGVHIIIYTPTGKIVMQKRAPGLKYHPGEVEVSAGGGVNAGESPSEAAVREAYEELGIKIEEKDIHFEFKMPHNYHHKGYHNKAFIYSYSICLPEDKLAFHSNKEENSQIFLITKKKLRQALMVHRIKNIGKIAGHYSYWKRLLNSI